MACYFYTANISSKHTLSATGNTIFFDYEVYVNYTDCDLNPQTITLGSGTWTDAICAEDNYSI